MTRRSPRPASEPEFTSELVHEVQARARPLEGWEDLDPLIERVGHARFVLLGEASHGTAEYYDWRRVITQRLIREKDFSFVAVEGDWPDCYRVNRYAKGFADAGETARDVLDCFRRWPTWMWANEHVVQLIEWLHEFNRDVAEDRRVGFYGLDVYSLWESFDAVLEYLDDRDGEAAAAARRAFACFEPYGYDVEDYARATSWTPQSCEDEVVAMLRGLRAESPLFEQDAGEARFNAEQNALVAKNAEKYYRTMIRGDAASWNVRDRHMAETLHRLMDRHGPYAKAIVWEHNTHVGDARQTDMAGEGMVNLGQLVREEYGAQDAVLVGFCSYQGQVVAGERWGAPRESMTVPPGRRGSWEHVLHEGQGDALVLLDPRDASPAMLEPRGHRAIGVVYRPQFEAYGNYVPTVLPRRYDALAFVDRTRALRPLHVPASYEHELPETYPSGV